LCKNQPAAGAAAAAAINAFDIFTEYLQLRQLPVPVVLSETVAKGIRVVREPSKAGAAVSLTLAVPETKFYFEQHLRKDFTEALSAACEGRTIVITDISAKPKCFRGGGGPSCFCVTVFCRLLCATSLPSAVVLLLWLHSRDFLSHSLSPTAHALQTQTTHTSMGASKHTKT
jgi:hypothetical protein